MNGARVRKARKKAGLSQATLAKKAGLRQCQISDIEQNKLDANHIHVGTLRKLCDELHVNADWLLEMEGISTSS